MLVTISGLPGSGTSTLARLVAPALGFDHLDGGTVFRAAAAEVGLTLAEFARRAEDDPAIDRALDDRLTERARAGDVVLESRLAGWLAHRAGLDALRVWVACDEAERAKRVSGREGHDHPAALAQSRVRERSERTRYLTYYGIDLADLSVYDLVVDSAAVTPDSLAATVVAAARAGVTQDRPAGRP